MEYRMEELRATLLFTCRNWVSSLDVVSLRAKRTIHRLALRLVNPLFTGVLIIRLTLLPGCPWSEEGGRLWKGKACSVGLKSETAVGTDGFEFLCLYRYTGVHTHIGTEIKCVCTHVPMV